MQTAAPAPVCSSTQTPLPGPVCVRAGLRPARLGTGRRRCVWVCGLLWGCWARLAAAVAAGGGSWRCWWAVGVAWWLCRDGAACRGGAGSMGRRGAARRPRNRLRCLCLRAAAHGACGGLISAAWTLFMHGSVWCLVLWVWMGDGSGPFLRGSERAAGVVEAWRKAPVLLLAPCSSLLMFRAVVFPTPSGCLLLVPVVPPLRGLFFSPLPCLPSSV